MNPQPLTKHMDRILEICAKISGMSLEESEAQWKERRLALIKWEKAEAQYCKSVFKVKSLEGMMRFHFKVSKAKSEEYVPEEKRPPDHLALWMRRYGWFDDDMIIAWVPVTEERTGTTPSGNQRKIERELAYILNPAKWRPLMDAVIESPF